MLENDEYIIPCNFGGRIANGFGSYRGGGGEGLQSPFSRLQWKGKGGRV